MSGRLIVIDGLDGSGKETQSSMLYKRLMKDGVKAHLIHFPNYEEPWCVPVKMYLAGEFGTSPEDVNAYTASAFYAVDRFASYKKKWKNYLINGDTIIADRYTTSNAIHQGSKLYGKERKDFFSWLYNFEFTLMGLPRPDVVFFLDMPPDISLELMKNRINKATGEAKKDIHESNVKYLYSCYNSAIEAVDHYGWNKIDCVNSGQLRTPKDIGNELYNKVKRII